MTDIPAELIEKAARAIYVVRNGCEPRTLFTNYKDEARAAKTRSGILSCQRCGGDGREWRSRYGGNDPDVWDAGPCKWCEGSGEQLCEDCGEYPATVRYTEGRDTFMLCSLCHKEWLDDE